MEWACWPRVKQKLHPLRRGGSDVLSALKNDPARLLIFHYQVLVVVSMTSKNKLSLRPVHYASVSGGKDSLYMLGVILKNIQKYPLDVVVHFELEIDWNWSKKVIDEMEILCKKANIPFLRIKPRKSWDELYSKFDVPTRTARWCNSDYKLDCKKQLNAWLKEQSCRPVAYIGFCADEIERFQYAVGEENWKESGIEVCYPLAEEGICENEVLEWAKKHPLLKDYYKLFKRQGCTRCPNMSRKELSFYRQTEPEDFEQWFEMIEKYEKKFNTYFWDKPCSEILKIIERKWTPILEMEQNQMSIFDFI